jgi:hypothetical protein
MICCGSGSDFGKCLVPDAFSISEAAYFPESWPLNFDFLTFFINFIVDPDPTVMHSGSGLVSAQTNSYGSCGSSSGSGSNSTTLTTLSLINEKFNGARISYLQAGGSEIQFWTMNNYHWYLKQCLSYPARQLLSPRWDPEDPHLFSLITRPAAQDAMQQDNLYETVRFSWATAASRGQTETDLAVVAVVDGHHIKVTPFRQAVVPPPMSAYEIHLGSQVESVLFAAAVVSAAAVSASDAAASAANPGLLSKACQDSNSLLVVTHHHVYIFTLDASSEDMSKGKGNVRVDMTGAGGTGYAPQTAHHGLAGSLQLSVKEGRLTNWVWCGDRLLASLASVHSSSAVLVFEVRECVTS